MIGGVVALGLTGWSREVVTAWREAGQRGGYYAEERRPVYKPYRPGRVWPFVFSLCQLAFLAWLIYTATLHGHPPADSSQVYRDAYSVGFDSAKWVACGIILALWVAFDIIVGVTTYIFRRD